MAVNLYSASVKLMFASQLGPGEIWSILIMQKRPNRIIKSKSDCFKTTVEIKLKIYLAEAKSKKMYAF